MSQIQTPESSVADRVRRLLASDPAFAAAVPSPDVAAAIRAADGDLIDTITAAMTGYAQRPALLRRARRVVRDRATGALVHEHLPDVESVSYSQLWTRACAFAATVHESRVEAGVPESEDDFVAVLGFTSIDYAVVDLGCQRAGSVVVPLGTGVPAAQLHPVLAETRPRTLAVDCESLDIGVELVLAADTVREVIVFDHDDRLDSHRDALSSAQARLSGRARVRTLDAELIRGASLADAPRHRDDGDRLASLIYTSGSTGEPKGAMYTRAMITRMWQNSRNGMSNAGSSADLPVPTIVLHYMPMSHVNGRSWLVSGLTSGGIGFFTASNDMSTLLEDISLAQPTVLSLVPRICDMVRQRFRLAQLSARERGAADDDAAEAAIREGLLGGRIVSALCGSAPLSADTKSFMEQLLGCSVIDCYGSTETTRPVVVNTHVKRPPVLEYKLVDVPELGYFRTDRPHPRGELYVRSTGLVPGYYRRPDLTAKAFDEQGFYRTGDVMAELGPDRLAYVDRTNNVLKLSQGEFVAVARLEAVCGASPLIRQIFVYGSGEQSYLLAVVVADTAAIGSEDESDVRAAVLASMRECAERESLRSWETPRDLLIEGEPFSAANGLLSGIGKLLRPALTAHYGPRLEELYAAGSSRRGKLAGRLREERERRPVLDTVMQAARLAAGTEDSAAEAGWSFADIGGDSLSAHTLSMLLTEIFDVEVPIRLIIGPTGTLADVARHVAEIRTEPSRRPSVESVHGPGAERVSAKDLQLEAFLDDALLTGALDLAPARKDVSTVLVTGATGYLGRFVLLDLLERATGTGGRVVCVARGVDAADARRRVLDCFGDPASEPGRHVADLAGRLDVLAGDVASSRFGLADAVWTRLCDDVDLIVHSAALVNHVLPYGQLFDSNVTGTAEVVRLALSTRRKRVAFVSSVAAAMRPDGTLIDEHADVRIDTGERVLDEAYANGYATTKWAGEVLLREAHDRFDVPVTVLRPDMILAHTRWPGQLNVPDRFTRLLLSVVATGLAPESFYRAEPGSGRARAHYSGLPVDFTAAAIVALAVESADGYQIYNTLNANDDGLSLDDFVDWLLDAGVRITRIDDFGQWRDRVETALRSLSSRQRAASVLPLLHAYAEPADPHLGRVLPNDRFAAGVHRLGVGSATVPSISPALIGKYVRDLASLGLLGLDDARSSDARSSENRSHDARSDRS